MLGMGEADSSRTPWAFEQKLRKGRQGPRLWRPPTNVHQWSNGDPKRLIKQFPLVNGENYGWLGAHRVGSVSWPPPRAGEECLVGISQSPCQSLGRYTVGLRTHACRCLWNGYQSHKLAPCLATPVIRSPLSPRRRGHMNVSLITFPCNRDVNPS